ncbi:MAG TPA: hypothetical protein VGK21_11305 [Candidatus Angelobacter sp.]
MQKSKHTIARIRSYAHYAFLLLAFQLAVAQATNCPQYTRIVDNSVTDNGMANDANMNVYLFNTSTASFSTSDDAGSARDSAETAVDGWVSMSGNNQDYTVSNYTGSLSDTALEATGTTANPVVVIEQLTPAAAATQCGGPPSCTIPIQNSNGVTTGAMVWVSTAIVNGTPPSNYPGTLAEVLSHEVGVHDDMGWQNCSGTNCGNSDAGIGLYTAPGPTSCDSKQFQEQKKTTC